MPTQSVYQDYANQMADKYGIPRNLFNATIAKESAWNPNAVSSAGAIGLGQLMPGTAKELGVNPYDPKQNLEGSAKYLSDQFKRFGNWALALSAYNSGPGGSEKSGRVENNPETKGYVKDIFDMLSESGLDAAFDMVPLLGNIPGLDGSTILAPASDGIKAAGSVLDFLLNFFTKSTLIRTVAIVIGVLFIIAAVITFVGGSKIAVVTKAVTKLAA